MKTKGQLEYLKIRIFTNIEDDIETKYGLFSQGYDNGYMQCQEDMADKNMENITIKSVTHCPTCGSECKVEGDNTHHYVPIKKYIEEDVAENYLALKELFEKVLREHIALAELRDFYRNKISEL